MTKNDAMKQAIQDVVNAMMDKVMQNVMISDPFLPEEFRAKKPLYAALVPEEIFKGSHFERRFTTPFGGVWEKLAVVAAKEGLGFGDKGISVHGLVKKERLRRITEILNSLEHPSPNNKNNKPNWDEEIKYIMDGDGENIPVHVICDVYAKESFSGKIFAFELKAPLPNSDQTKVSKEKILKLYAMEPRIVDEAYFALPYNPYGKKENYAWSFPSRWFDMKKDSVVLIGDEFWEKIGGLGTYQAFIDAVNEIGIKYKTRIYKEYLGLEPSEKLEATSL